MSLALSAYFEVRRGGNSGNPKLITGLTTKDAGKTRLSGFLPKLAAAEAKGGPFNRLFDPLVTRKFIAAGTEKAISRLTDDGGLLCAAENAQHDAERPIVPNRYEFAPQVRSMIENKGYVLLELGRTGKYLIGLKEEETALAALKARLEKPESGELARELVEDYFGINVSGADRLTDNGWLKLHQLLLAGPVEDVFIVADNGQTHMKDGRRIFEADRLIGPGRRVSEVIIDDPKYGTDPTIVHHLGILRIQAARLNNPGTATS